MLILSQSHKINGRFTFSIKQDEIYDHWLCDSVAGAEVATRSITKIYVART